jgi:hypothetical protein
MLYYICKINQTEVIKNMKRILVGILSLGMVFGFSTMAMADNWDRVNKELPKVSKTQQKVNDISKWELDSNGQWNDASGQIDRVHTIRTCAISYNNLKYFGLMFDHMTDGYRYEYIKEGYFTINMTRTLILSNADKQKFKTLQLNQLNKINIKAHDCYGAMGIPNSEEIATSISEDLKSYTVYILPIESKHIVRFMFATSFGTDLTLNDFSDLNKEYYELTYDEFMALFQ